MAIELLKAPPSKKERVTTEEWEARLDRFEGYVMKLKQDGE